MGSFVGRTKECAVSAWSLVAYTEDTLPEAPAAQELKQARVKYGWCFTMENEVSIDVALGFPIP